jgi:hypothetical protein
VCELCGRQDVDFDLLNLVFYQEHSFQVEALMMIQHRFSESSCFKREFGVGGLFGRVDSNRDCKSKKTASSRLVARVVLPASTVTRPSAVSRRKRARFDFPLSEHQ